MRFGGVCVAMSCGGGGFSPDDARDSAWDSVIPTRGNSLSITSSTKTLFGADVVWWWFYSLWCLRFLWDSVKLTGKFFFNYFQYQEDVGCVAMSCGGYSFSPFGAYDFAWDSVKP